MINHFCTCFRLTGKVMATCFLDCAAVNLRVRGDEHLENVRTPHKPQAREAPSPMQPPNTPSVVRIMGNQNTYTRNRLQSNSLLVKIGAAS